MNKYLSQKGFSSLVLIVAGFFLLLIISIYFVGMFISNGEKVTRDNKRKGDIQIISKALELHYMDSSEACPGQSSVSRQSTYCPLQDDWFKGPSLVPKDSQKDGIMSYCMKVLAEDGRAIENPQAWITKCPEGWVEPAVGQPPINTKIWKVCTSFELNKTTYCLSNQL